jgi:hypothetical protein
MSKRLQVLLDEKEFAELRAAARRRGVSVSVYVREALREARGREPNKSLETKLRALRRAMQYDAPAPDIEQMLEETERGYLEPLPE